MKIAFVMPCVGRKPGQPYVKTWQMEPLVFAVLSALTPREINRVLYDDRVESIPYDDPVDLAAISVETYTAKRAYQIAAEFRRRRIPVVMGGFHATLVPQEVMEHADSVVIGQAEKIWPELIRDFQNGRMRHTYEQTDMPDLSGIFPDRSVYRGKKYAHITLVETGRGCPFTCEFCSITSFFKRGVNARPVGDVVSELASLPKKNVVFFIDDNIVADIGRSRRFFIAMKPLKIKWVGQVSVNAARDEGLITLMKASGCLGVLIGFESMNSHNVVRMGKAINNEAKDYDDCLAVFRRHGLIVYATFMFGYDHDTADTFRQTYDFARRHKFFFTAFNHLVPFPGTPLYRRLHAEKKLFYDRWWLERDYVFGDVAFAPGSLSAERVSSLCLSYRRKMYSIPSILFRGLDVTCNCQSLFLALAFFTLNILSGRDVGRRQGLPLGA